MEEAKKETAEVILKCIYGNKVKLQNLKNNTITEYTLVPLAEEKLSENKISNYTTIGKAIWSKVENDIVNIPADHNQSIQYKIVEIENA